MLSFHQQSCLLGTLQEQDAALQETQQQVAYEQALTGHLYCVLEQVRAAAEAAASDDSTTGGSNLLHPLQHASSCVYYVSK